MTTTGLSLKLDAMKTLAKLGGLEPQPNAVAAGPGFSISINLPGATTSSPPQMATIDVTPVPVHRNADLYLPEGFDE